MGAIPTKEEIIAKINKLDEEEREMNRKLKQIQSELNKNLPAEDRIIVKDNLDESDIEDGEEEEKKLKLNMNHKYKRNIDEELESNNNKSNEIDESSSKGGHLSNSKINLDSIQEEHELIESDHRKSNNSIHLSSKDEEGLHLSDDNVI